MSDLLINNDTRGSDVCLTSYSSAWAPVAAAGIINTQDVAVVINPGLLYTATPSRLFARPKGRGTNLLLRLKYDAAVVGITDPIIVVFGRRDSADSWMALPTIAGNRTVTLTTAASDDGATDVTDATWLWSAVDTDDRTVDCLGCNQFIIGVQTALAGTGAVTTAVVEGKFI